MRSLSSPLISPSDLFFKIVLKVRICLSSTPTYSLVLAFNVSFQDCDLDTTKVVSDVDVSISSGSYSATTWYGKSLHTKAKIRIRFVTVQLVCGNFKEFKTEDCKKQYEYREENGLRANLHYGQVP